MYNQPPIETLIGLTMKNVRNVKNKELIFDCEDGRCFMLYHDQDCCESVTIEDIIGDLNDLIGSPITQAEEVSSEGYGKRPHSDDSFTWTFYKFATRKGYVTVRWYGESNGYYGEGVDFMEVQ